MSSQVVRPVMPYRGPIPGGMREGKLIEIRGSCPYGCQRFEVNLHTGLDPYSDRALHISVRFDEGVVVRNTMERGSWGVEERHGQFPFSHGSDFMLTITAELAGYYIGVNGQNCYEYNHRMPNHRVSSLHIDGSVHVERIEFIDKGSPYMPEPRFPHVPGDFVTPGFPVGPGICPEPAIRPAIDPGFYPNPGTFFPDSRVITPPEQICPDPGYIPTGDSNLTPVYNPTIPYAYPIYGGLKIGMMVFISGRPLSSAQRFTINFQSGTGSYPPPDIAFHMDVRFFSRAIVRNSRNVRGWEREEDHVPYFPFQQDVPFDMTIRVEVDKYTVDVNGQRFLEFRHRQYPLDRFDTLYIENDVDVSSIRFA